MSSDLSPGWAEKVKMLLPREAMSEDDLALVVSQIAVPPITSSQFLMILNGKVSMRPGVLEAVAKALNVEVDSLR